LLLFLPLSISLSLRIGHLQRYKEERNVILSCFPANQSAFDFVTLPACKSFNGVDNAATMRYLDRIDAFVGANCIEEAPTISRLTERWNSPF
ncbi:hypothetical protein PFISCL1PPCAC_28486, partial [Pristionchus fissidentatus]